MELMVELSHYSILHMQLEPIKMCSYCISLALLCSLLNDTNEMLLVTATKNRYGNSISALLQQLQALLQYTQRNHE
jgi:hypothetical protein